ncbi:MAG: CvpA family protein [Ruminococcus sp.]|nr:CvpA family protein [Ruminococcus sp.]
MSFALDLAVVALVVICAAIGFARGFIRYLIKLIGTITCVIMALVISDMAAPTAYNDIIAPRLQKALEREFRDFDMTAEMRQALEKRGTDIGLTDEELKEALSDSGSIPAAMEKSALRSGQNKEQAEELRLRTQGFFEKDFGSALFEQAGFNNHEELGERMDISAGKAYDLVRAFTEGEDNSRGIEYIVRNVIDGMMTTLIRFALFVILFILLEALLAVVFMIAGVLDHLPAVSGANRAAGLLLGACKGCMYVLLAGWICAKIVHSGSLISASTFEETFVFRYAFRLFY